MNERPASEWRELFVGVEREVATVSGPRRYINFDNAASTPALCSVCDTVNAYKLSRRLPLTKDAVVLVSFMEHHSKLLPWRERAQVETVAWERAVGVRQGCFCAHLYVFDLLHVSPEHAHEVRHAIEAGDRRAFPDAVRVSRAVQQRSRGGPVHHGVGGYAAGRIEAAYVQDRATSEFAPVGWTSEFAPFFSLAQPQGVPV